MEFYQINETYNSTPLKGTRLIAFSVTTNKSIYKIHFIK